MVLKWCGNFSLKQYLFILFIPQGLPGIAGITGPPGPSGDPGDMVSVLVITWPTRPGMNLEPRTHRTHPGGRGRWLDSCVDGTNLTDDSEPLEGTTNLYGDHRHQEAMTHLIVWPNLLWTVCLFLQRDSLFTHDPLPGWERQQTSNCSKEPKFIIFLWQWGWR